jgi:hypothetical protein
LEPTVDEERKSQNMVVIRSNPDRHRIPLFVLLAHSLELHMESYWDEDLLRVSQLIHNLFIPFGRRHALVRI